MRFLRDAIITIIVLALVIWIAAYARIRTGGLSADAQPGAIERGVATRLVRLSIPADADDQRNPFVGDSNAWRSVVDHYQDHCATCHGSDGHGKTDIGGNMYPKVPDLADPNIQRMSDGALFHIIQNGVRWTGMPAWKREHSAEESWKLVSFTRKIPSLTPQEIEQLEKNSHDESHEGETPSHHEHKHPESHRKPQ
jgi:mono/diheme cytochrome c family protein